MDNIIVWVVVGWNVLLSVGLGITHYKYHTRFKNVNHRVKNTPINAPYFHDEWMAVPLQRIIWDIMEYLDIEYDGSIEEKLVKTGGLGDKFKNMLTGDKIARFGDFIIAPTGSINLQDVRFIDGSKSKTAVYFNNGNIHTLEVDFEMFKTLFAGWCQEEAKNVQN